MFKALFALIGGAVIIVPLLLILAAAVGGSGNTLAAPAQVERIPQQGSFSPDEVRYLSAIGFTAAFVAIVAGANSGAAWAAFPIGIWALIFMAMRYRAQSRPAQDAHPQEPPPAPRTKESFGKDGVVLLERADTAVDKVMASEAVQDGWLGPPDGIDLRADVRVIEDRLKRVSGIRDVIAELSRLPDPSDADRKRKDEAKRAEMKLHKDAQDRVKRLEDLAREVQATDRELRLRSLTDIGEDQAASSPEVVDSTREMLSAYREVKGLPDLELRSNESDSKTNELQKSPANSSQGFLDMLKQWWSE